VIPPAALPLPGDGDTPFDVLVDLYVSAHRVRRAETSRRIAAVTGNSTNGLALRYRQRYDAPWRFSSPLFIPAERWS